MKKKQYTRDELLYLLSCYKRMIERNKDVPAVLIDDLEKSIIYVLARNGYIE